MKSAALTAAGRGEIGMTILQDAWTRRHVLSKTAALGMAALAPASAFGASHLCTPNCRIDVHHHFLPQPYMLEEHRRLAKYTHGAMTANQLLHWTPEQAIEVMNQNGIEMSIGSISTPGVWYGDVAAARRLSREWNEAAARTVQDYPSRFGFFGVVAPPDTEGALSEIAYALDVLKADGIGLLSNYDGKELGDPSFTPVLEELNRRKTVVFVHPTVAPCCAGLIPGVIPQTIEFPLDTTRTITSLVASGTLARLNNIRWIFSHGGGTLPFLADRISYAFGLDKEISARNPKGIEYQLKQLYCDTALATSAPQLAAMLAFFPLSNILFGSDYPFVPPSIEIQDIELYKMPPQFQAAINRNNALKLLPRLQSV